MRRWIVLGLPVFIALLTFGIPMKGFAAIEDNTTAVDDSTAVGEIEFENIGNDSQEGTTNANDKSIAVGEIEVKKEVEVKDVANDNQKGKVNANDNSWATDLSDNQKGKTNANNHSIAVDLSDNQKGKVNANNHSIAVDLSDNQKGKVNANNHSIAVDASDNLKGKVNANDYSTAINVELEDVDVAVAASTLSGTVSYNEIKNGVGLGFGKIETGDNYLGGCEYSVKGINQNAQNTGINSQIQQNINFQANMD